MKQFLRCNLTEELEKADLFVQIALETVILVTKLKISLKDEINMTEKVQDLSQQHVSAVSKFYLDLIF